jgi:hypothetical protein
VVSTTYNAVAVVETVIVMSPLLATSPTVAVT